MHPRAHARLTGWIAVLAILLASLAPSLSHALGAADAAAQAEICTAQGRMSVEHPDGSTSPVPAAGHVFEHCPFCSIDAPIADLPPPPAATVRADTADSGWPVAVTAAPSTQRAWPSAPPRAPPPAG